MGEPARDLLDEPVISFGPFQLRIAERRLLKDDAALAVSSRSLDILIALIERAGEVVGKKELVARVWPDVIVGESSLRVYIAALRKVLGDGRDGMRYIANVPGRGYSFVAPITLTRRETAPPTEQPAKLPPKLLRVIDRQETIERVCAQLLERRFVTIVGPGGMGKTTVGVAVAHALVPEFAGAVFFVDLASVAVPGLVAEAVGSTMGFPTCTDEPASSLIADLEQRRLMLVLDNCEHQIDSVAILAERICRAAPRVHILATSREPLRAEGEYIRASAPRSPAGARLCRGTAHSLPCSIGATTSWPSLSSAFCADSPFFSHFRGRVYARSGSGGRRRHEYHNARGVRGAHESCDRVAPVIASR